MRSRRQKWALRFELFGGLCLLLAGGAQLFRDDLGSLVGRGDHYEIAWKLDTLWVYAGQIASEQDPIKRQLAHNDLSRRYWQLSGNLEQAEKQGIGFGNVYIAFYLMGTLLLLGGRYLEKTPAS